MFLNIEIVTAWQDVRDISSIPLHRHYYNELVYYTSTSGKAVISGEEFDFASQYYGFIPAGYAHKEIHHTHGRIICIGFVGEVDLSMGFFPDTDNRLHTLFHEVVREASEQDIGYKDMLVAKVSELIVEMRRSERGVPIRTEAKNLEYVMNYITNNY